MAQQDFDRATRVIPLIIPDNCIYDESTKEMRQIGKERTKLQVYPPALEYLRTIRSRVGVISIAGKARTGKSLVAGELISPQEQPCPFELGNTMNACTYGIWLAEKTIAHPEDDDMRIIVLDVEGTDAHSADAQSDTQLMVVSLLISSLLIFNSKGVFDATSLDQIEFILQLTQKITCAKGATNESGQDFNRFFPVFVWLLRDCHLDPSVDENTVTVRDYLVRHVLRCEMDFSAAGMKRTFIRNAFQNMFPSFDAFGLPPPTSETELLKQLGTIDRSLLNPEFVEKLEEFVQTTLQQVPYKKILSAFGDEVDEEEKNMTSSEVVCTGEHLVEWIEACVNSVNEGVPNIQTIGESVISRMLQNCFDTCTAFFRSELDNRILQLQQGDVNAPVLPIDLKTQQNEVINLTFSEHGNDLELENSNPTLDAKRRELLERLQTEADEYCDRLIEQNSRRVMQYCRNWISTEYNTIQVMLENVEELEADDLITKFEEFQTQFNQLPFVGTSGHTEAWASFVPTFKSDQEMFQRARNWSEQKAALAEERALLVEQNQRQQAQVDAITQEQELMEQRFRDELERERTRQAEQVKTMEDQLKQEQQRINDLHASHNEELARLHEEKQKEMETALLQMQTTITELANRPPPAPVVKHIHHEPDCNIL